MQAFTGKAKIQGMSNIRSEYTSLHSAICDIYGEEVSISDRVPVSGGDINSACSLKLSNGERLFMKSNSRGNIGFFRAESEGLKAIRRTQTTRTPKVLAIGTDENCSFLLLEYIESGRGGKASSEELGIHLAHMHRAETRSFVPGGRYGFSHDNYIGAGVQVNTPHDSWVDFFRKCRLMPQIKLAQQYFDSGDRKKIDKMIGKLDQILTEPEYPSLLHGDLWAGNYMIDESAHPWLIDPAAYVGHAEADLAMTELFGGFDRAFYDAYRNTAGIDPGYKDRRDLYNLYHLLNHLNLFGGGYLYSVRSVLSRYDG